MAHNVETMAYFGSRPWHGLGTEVLQLMTAEEALEKAGLDWEVEKRKVFFEVDGKNVHIPNKYATVRTSDNYPLGIVGDFYTPVQNVEALNFVDALTATKEAKYETAGSLQHGKIVWIMAKIPNSHGVDPVESYLLCTTSHDGSSPVMVTATPVRVVCNNTLNAALRTAKNKFRIRHTTKVEQKIEEARRVLAQSVNYFKVLNEKFEYMKNEKFTETMLADAVLKVFKNSDDVEELSKRQKASLDCLVDKIVDLSHNGKGVDLPGVKGTAWGGYNAIVEYLDYYSPIKESKRKDISIDEKRMSSIWFGSIADKTQAAFDTILEMTKLAA